MFERLFFIKVSKVRYIHEDFVYLTRIKRVLILSVLDNLKEKRSHGNRGRRGVSPENKKRT